MAKLIITQPDGRSAEVPLGDHNTVGRHPDNLIQLPDAMVSKHHALIVRSGDRFVIRDLDSRNGTMLDGERIDEAVLAPRKRFVLGKTQIEFLGEVTMEDRSILNRVTITATDRAKEKYIRTRLEAHDMATFRRASEIADLDALVQDYEKLRVAHELNQFLGADANIDRLLRRILDKAFEMLPAERGVVLLQNSAGSLEPRAAKARAGKPAEEEIVVSQTMVETAVQERQALLFYDAASDPRLESAPSVHIHGIRSAMCVPMIYKDRVYGILHFDTKQAAGAFGEKDLRLLSGIANQAAISLENAYLASELTQSEGRLRKLIESIPDMIAVIRDDRFTFVNPAMVDTLGYSAATDLIGLPISAVLTEKHKPDTLGIPTAWRQERGAFFTGEERLSCRDGSTLIAEITSLPLEFDGGAANLIIARDVTERRELQARLLQADRMVSIGTLAAGVAHEINNPLAYVIANLQYLTSELPVFLKSLQDEVDLVSLSNGLQDGWNDVLKSLRDSWEGAERVRHIVRDLKTFSRTDDEYRGPVDVRAVLDSSISMAWSEIRHRAKLLKEFRDVLPVEANESRLGQVFLNLLVNAAQAIRVGDVGHNEIRIRTDMGNEEQVVVEIADSGPGIPEEIQSRIFDPFFTTKPQGVGTGLGLSICHGIVSALGGEISFSCPPEGGTVFRIELPALEVEERQRESIDMEPTRTAPASRSRILIIDDEPALVDALRRSLQAEHSVAVADSGRAALDLLGRGTRFDVVFCDLNMADLTGMDLYESLRREVPGAERRLIFMTGGPFTARTREFLKRIPNPRIDKPFDMKIITALLRDRSWIGDDLQTKVG